MKVWAVPALWVCALSLAACGSSGSRREAPRDEPVRALLSTDALLFSDFDADGDFQISAAEIEAGVTREFARADSNSDGSLGPIEYQNWSNSVLGGGMTPPFRLDFDRNVDNVISAEEFRNEITARGGQYDADENGMITRAELVRTINQTRAPARQMRNERPMGGVTR
jgi:hypothetical protein